MERTNLSQYDQQQQQDLAPYTEFFSWGSDAYGQLALANSDDDDQQQYYGQPPQPQFYDEPKSLSFDIIIHQISCGDYHAAFISGDGFLFAFGRNSEGQLGVGDPSLMKSSAPLLIDSLPKDFQLLQVSCGGSHTAALISNGDIYTWGQGQYGATGLNTQQNTYAPLKVKATESASQLFTYLSCGKKHTMVVDSEGQVLVCGDNTSRQLGISHTEKVLSFKQIPNFYQKATKVAAGVEHSLILTRDGDIYAAGNNQQGNLGLGHIYSSDSFLSVHGLQNLSFTNVEAGRHSAALTEDNRLFVWGPVFQNESPLILPQELRSNKLIKSVSVGAKTTAIIDEDCHLYTWGFNNVQGYQKRNDSPANDDDGQMPQFVESLSFKQVTQVAVGQDFIISLGQDFDQNGLVVQRDGFQSQNDSKFQLQDNSQLVKSPPSSNSSQSRPNNEAIGINKFDPIQVKPQDDLSTRYDPKPQAKPPLLRNNLEKPATYDYDYQRREREPAENRNNYSAISSNSKKSHERQTTSNNRPPLDDSSFASSQVAFDRNNSADRFRQETSHSRQQQPVPSASAQAFNYQSNTNAELYKQIDQLRDENFQLKQKQREILKTLNELKVENDQLLQNADSEIKRMSDFVDKYTQDVEQTKRQLHQEYEEKLIIERRKADEVKQKLHKDQNEVEMKLDRLQKEIESMRQDNIQLQSSKAEAQLRARDLQEQLNLAQQQLRSQHLQNSTSSSAYQQPKIIDRERNNFSPLAQTPIQKNIRIEENMQKQMTPSSYQQRPPAINNYERSNLKQSKEKQQPTSEELQYSVMKNNNRDQDPRSGYNSQSKYGYPDEQVNSRQQNQDPQQQFYTIENKQEKTNNHSPYNHRNSQQNVSNIRNNDREPLSSESKLPINSPQRQLQLDEQQQQPSSKSRKSVGVTYQNHQVANTQYQETEERPLEDYRRESNYNNQYQSRTVPSQPDKPKYDIPPQYQQQAQPPLYSGAGGYQSVSKSPQYNGTPSTQLPSHQYKQDSVIINPSIHTRVESPQESRYSSTKKDSLNTETPGQYSRPTTVGVKESGKENPNHQRTGSNGGEDKNALNDVKNRLLIMQKNKEELEEKLKNYENKIRQHYNKQ